MNIKSLLLGSAAALVAVSGARAADAVTMVEPEPVEYVRVCDVYGAGYFYIPGTETCLKIGGYVRMRAVANDGSRNADIDNGNLNAVVNPGDSNGLSNDDYNANFQVRARLDFDAREETELGMLRGFIRVQATNNSFSAANNANGTLTTGYVMDSAFLQIGGLTVGKLDSLWAERDGLFTDNDWSVGDFNNNRISYTFATNGFTAAVSVEDDGSGDFVPDIVGQLAYAGGWGEAYVSGVFDEQSGQTINSSLNGIPTLNYTTSSYANSFALYDPALNTFTVTNFFNGDVNDDDSAFALKAGVTLKDLLMAGSQFKVEGSYAFDPTVYTTSGYIANEYNGTTFGNEIVGNNGLTVYQGAANGAFNLSTKFQVGAGYQQSFGKLTAYLSGVYGQTFDLEYVTAVSGTGVVTTRNLGEAEFYGVAGNVGYDITKNLSVLGELSYRKIDMPSGLNDFDQTGGFLEIKRSF